MTEPSSAGPSLPLGYTVPVDLTTVRRLAVDLRTVLSGHPDPDRCATARTRLERILRDVIDPLAAPVEDTTDGASFRDLDLCTWTRTVLDEPPGPRVTWVRTDGWSAPFEAIVRDHGFAFWVH